jgi:hypothetical protein
MFILKGFKSNVLEVFIPGGLEASILEVRIPKELEFLRGLRTRSHFLPSRSRLCDSQFPVMRPGACTFFKSQSVDEYSYRVLVLKCCTIL